MKPEFPDSDAVEALRSLQTTIHRPTGPATKHKEMTMQRVFATQRRSLWRSHRILFGGGALFLCAGLSYATGLAQRVSNWFVTVEEIDDSTDRVISESVDYPEAGTIEGEVPKEKTDELVDLIEGGEFMTVEPVENGFKFSLHQPDASAAKPPPKE